LCQHQMSLMRVICIRKSRIHKSLQLMKRSESILKRS
jgi:hypothetical protein